MAGRLAPRVVHNRGALDAAVLAVADGLGDVAEEIVRTAQPPDSPFDPFPTGEGLPKQGGWGVWVDGQKTSGGTLRGDQPRKPRGMTNKGIEAVAGFGFPARLVELGTVTTHAQPFLSEAVARVLPGAMVTISKAVKRRLAGVRDTTVSDKIAAARARKAARSAEVRVDLADALRAAAARMGR